MKCCSLLFLLWVIIPAATGQSLYPGGVQGATHWYITDPSAPVPGLRSQLDKKDLLTFGTGHAAVQSLNFHPSLVFSGHPLRIALGAHPFNSVSFFTVYQSADTADEGNIWHTTKNGKTNLVLTTDRMADLGVYQYMNYIDVVRDQPKVNIYVQQKDKDSFPITEHSWYIGNKPVSPQLPVANFKGLIPEVIAYDRVLNSRERLQVASYLSLKYGITLTDPAATYLNSAGQKIWDGFEYSRYHRNIAGLCRDDSAGLQQKIAGSSNTPGLLTIASREPFPNNVFLLWGENGAPLIVADKISGVPRLLQKKWLMKPTGNPRSFITDIILDTKPVDVALPPKPVFWLAIDVTGEGNFSLPSTTFIRMDQLDRDGHAHFNKVAWDKDGSGKDVWGIIVAQELLLFTVITQPSCTAPGTGSLQVKILGGKAPYRLTVQNTAGQIIHKQSNSQGEYLPFPGLSAGKYFLKVTDAAQQLYTDSFYINNEDAPLPTAVAASYILPAGRSLSINAAEDMQEGLSWQWSGPEGFQSFNPQVSITHPGLYTLRCSKNGCANEQDVLVKATPHNVLQHITVYPNPTAGAFTAKVFMEDPAPVTMTVYAADGKIIHTQKGTGRANYLFKGDLKMSGIYELVFTSGLSKASRRLVVAK